MKAFWQLSKILTMASETESLIGLLAHRSLYAYTGVLSILGVGSGYVPINPKNPVQRNVQIIHLSKVKLFVVGKECEHFLNELLASVSEEMTFILLGFEDLAPYMEKYPQHNVLDECLQDKGRRRTTVRPGADYTLD